MQLNRNIFREYDIRGISETDLKGDLPRKLGLAFGAYVLKEGRKKVCVGGDNRLSTPWLKKQVEEGLSLSGCEVVDIGIIPTPAMYYAVNINAAEAGVMVTASHNPPDYNGFKMVSGKRSLHGPDIQKLADYMESHSFPVMPAGAGGGRGRISSLDILDSYASRLTSGFSFKKKFRIGVDTGNGTLGPFIMKVLEPLGIDVVPLYLESDPSFPHHLPDPLVAENLQDLVNAVHANKLDAGFAYDGDGDRLGVVDDKGDILWGDRLMILYARDLLARLPGAPVVFDVKCTRALEDEIRKAGGRPVMWKTGHSLIEEKLHKEKAPLAGELSGHIYFADEYYGYDDAVYASLRLLRIMDGSKEPLSGLFSGVRRYFSTPEIRMEIDDKKKFLAVEKIRSFYADGYHVEDLDGVKVYFPEGWALVRASNTQPAIVVRVEAETEASLESIRIGFLARINESLRELS